MDILTIGHSNVPAERIIALLMQHGIEVLVDVRSVPYSRYNPQFNRETFQHTLEANSVEYAYAGQYLGGRPDDPTCYEGERVQSSRGRTTVLASSLRKPLCTSIPSAQRFTLSMVATSRPEKGFVHWAPSCQSILRLSSMFAEKVASGITALLSWISQGLSIVLAVTDLGFRHYCGLPTIARAKLRGSHIGH